MFLRFCFPFRHSFYFSFLSFFFLFVSFPLEFTKELKASLGVERVHMRKYPRRSFFFLFASEIETEEEERERRTDRKDR